MKESSYTSHSDDTNLVESENRVYDAAYDF